MHGDQSTLLTHAVWLLRHAELLQFRSQRPRSGRRRRERSAWVGHPVVATVDSLFIQVTRLLVPGPGGADNATTLLFHVAVNNLTDSVVTATLSSSFVVVNMPRQHITLRPGEHRVLQ
jgi:hypothetical protein